MSVDLKRETDGSPVCMGQHDTLEIANAVFVDGHETTG